MQSGYPFEKKWNLTEIGTNKTNWIRLHKEVGLLEAENT
jgi:hypothetical protein